MKTIRLIPILFLIFPWTASTQTNQSGDILDKVNGIISTMPVSSGNEYVAPSPAQLADWTTLLQNLFAGQYATAAAQATALGYDLVHFSDNTNSETYYVLEKSVSSTNYWGTYILNPSADRNQLILSAPHPKFDTNTGKQAAYCFKITDARFFMMSGTHRCNQSSFSNCSGTTTACASPAESYRISDMAHVTNAIWQVTTEYIADNMTGTFFVQLHGFSMQAGDPYVIMSNGTRLTPSPDPVVTLRDKLLVVEPILTFKIAHIDLTWTRLIGFTNTNGRYINASNAPCSSNATTTNGRFLHIEQEYTRLRENMAGWDKMATALSQTFPLAPLPVELTDFRATLTDEQVKLSWVTHSELNNDFFQVEKSADGSNFSPVGVVDGKGNSHGAEAYEFWDQPFDGDNYYRLRQVDFDGTFHFSLTRHLFFPPGYGRLNSAYSIDHQIIIKWNEQVEGALFRLFDSMGRLVATKKVREDDTVFDATSLPNGIYFYLIENGSGFLSTGKLFLKKG